MIYCPGYSYDYWLLTHTQETRADREYAELGRVEYNHAVGNSTKVCAGYPSTIDRNYKQKTVRESDLLLFRRNVLKWIDS